MYLPFLKIINSKITLLQKRNWGSTCQSQSHIWDRAFWSHSYIWDVAFWSPQAYLGCHILVSHSHIWGLSYPYLWPNELI